MSIPIRFKRNTAANWAAENPVLPAGEPALERNTGNMKIGNGISRWNDLPYVGQQLPEAVTVLSLKATTPQTITFVGSDEIIPGDTSPNF